MDPWVPWVTYFISTLTPRSALAAARSSLPSPLKSAAITVSGPASTVDALVDELGRRIAEEAPRQTHETPDDASATVTCDLGARKGVREYLKCLLYRMEEVVDPHSHEKLGERPVVLGEGFMTRVREQASVAAVFPRSEGSDMGKIEAGTYVVLK